jgi:hypothetical protein
MGKETQIMKTDSEQKPRNIELTLLRAFVIFDIAARLLTLAIIQAREVAQHLRW